jgi:hypothetical protein
MEVPMQSWLHWVLVGMWSLRTSSTLLEDIRILLEDLRILLEDMPFSRTYLARRPALLKDLHTLLEDYHVPRASTRVFSTGDNILVLPIPVQHHTVSITT